MRNKYRLSSSVFERESEEEKEERYKQRAFAGSRIIGRIS